MCGRKKSRFIKEQEASRLLSSLGLKTPIPSILPIASDKIVNKLLLAKFKFMSKMHLRLPFTKHKERIQKFKEDVNSRYIYQNKLAKACF